MNIRLIFIPPLLAAVSFFAAAAPAPAAARAEIDALLSSLAASGCEFNRNGSWHTAAEARDHLLRKLEYLEGKDAVKRAEDFIELAASTSSASGKAYQVRCAGQGAVDSKVWMLARLKVVRASNSRP